MLLQNRPDIAASVAHWQSPKLPISGGSLIERGLTQGPMVAKALQAIERQWVERGFPEKGEFERIVEGVLATVRS